MNDTSVVVQPAYSMVNKNRFATEISLTLSVLMCGSSPSCHIKITRNWLRVHIDEATNIGKPLFVGEFGKQRPVWERNIVFETIYRQLLEAASQGWAVAGGHSPDICFHVRGPMCPNVCACAHVHFSSFLTCHLGAPEQGNPYGIRIMPTVCYIAWLSVCGSMHASGLCPGNGG
jgi:hypothetical protein